MPDGALSPALDDDVAAAAAIVQMDVFHARLPVRSPRGHGIGTVADASDHVFLRLETDAGLVGWGEASPWAVFTGTAEGNAAALERYMRPYVVGADPSRISEIMDAAGRSVVQAFEAKAALETALFDLLGQASGLAIAELLGGRCRDRIPLSFSVANPEFEADREMIDELYRQGVRLFKLKAGFAGHAFDVGRLETLRADYGDLDLRVDYNQGLQPHEAMARLRDIAMFRPTFIEQPVPVAARAAMARITADLDTPILADEMIFSPADMLRAVDERLCDLVSVKIMKTGGLRSALHVAAIAEAAGLAAYGGDMFESGVAHLAGTHMIAAAPNISLGCEFYQARWYLERDVLAGSFPVDDGHVIVPRTPGLGLSVDEDVLRHYTVAHLGGGRP